MGGVPVYLHAILTSALDADEWPLHVRVTSPPWGEFLWESVGYETEWAVRSVRTLWEAEKYVLSLSEVEPRFPSFASCILIAIARELTFYTSEQVTLQLDWRFSQRSLRCYFMHCNWSSSTFRRSIILWPLGLKVSQASSKVSEEPSSASCLAWLILRP
jgi:hypothetical protein